MKPSTKTLLAACALVLASSAMAQDSNWQTRRQAYNDAVSSANANYDQTIAGCKSMSGDERRTCYGEAKATRNQAKKDAREQRRALAHGTDPGNTPADRMEVRASNPQSRTRDDPTP